MTINGYYTSRIGIHQDLQYKGTPRSRNSPVAHIRSIQADSSRSLARLKLGLAGHPETYFVLGSRAKVINVLPLAMAIYCLLSLT